ncbi:MAG: DUF1294 domain-containing protein [Lachnospiraceae bacterium]|nr:DUF1294 domain-containing protein [Lachnospiraceae bacterium]
MQILPLYLIAINVITFIAFGLDKWKAQHGKWRIKEKTLLGLSFIGGALGGLCAMYVFRHKIRKPVFVIGIPLMLLAQAALLIYLQRTGTHL